MVSPKPHCQISDKIKYNKNQGFKAKKKKNCGEHNNMKAGSYTSTDF
jgi:hypothetical protein